MKRSTTNLLFASLVYFMLAAFANAVEQPNIVLIFIDDMGYGDIGPFGNQVNKTPHLDQMAKEGNVLRQFYVANTACTPSRSALMTGAYAHRIGMDGSVLFPGEHRGLNPNEITIAEMLKAEGYATGCFGKWHLGDQPEFLPLAQGFEKYFGIPYSNDMWPGNSRGNPVTNRGPYTPLPVLSQNEVVGLRRGRGRPIPSVRSRHRSRCEVYRRTQRQTVFLLCTPCLRSSPTLRSTQAAETGSRQHQSVKRGRSRYQRRQNPRYAS